MPRGSLLVEAPGIDLHMPPIPVFLLALCLVLVLAGVGLFFWRPQIGFPVAMTGVILLLVMMLAHAR